MVSLPKPVTRRTAERHEALYLRLSSLLRQVEAAAGKRADAPVGAIMQRLGEELLFEADRFARARRVLRPVAPDLVGLATQLGQALAALDGFEGTHSAWSPDIAAFAWSVQGTPMPIARLRPRAQAPTHPAMLKIVDIQHRQLLAMHQRLEHRAKEGTNRGV